MTTGNTTSASISETFSNMTFTVEMPESVKAPVISNRLMTYLNIYLLFVTCGFIALFGTVNNIFNMIIFHKMGLGDSISVGLMALSLNDFLLCFFSLVRITYFIWDFLNPGLKINPLAIHQITTGWFSDIFFLCSAWFTAYLSVERCVCVVFPFKVKQIFTKFRSITVVVIIYSVNVGAHLPVLATRSLEWKKVEVSMFNNTASKDLLVIKYPDSWPQIQLYIDIANGAILPMPSQALVVISVIWMIYGLKASSKVRRSNVADKDTSNTKGEASNLSSKERRLIKLVLAIAIILTICNVPRFIAVYAKQIFPQINFSSSYRNLYKFLWTMSNMASTINASVNIFVYIKINVSYRETFKGLFRKK